MINLVIFLLVTFAGSAIYHTVRGTKNPGKAALKMTAIVGTIFLAFGAIVLLVLS